MRPSAGRLSDDGVPSRTIPGPPIVVEAANAMLSVNPGLACVEMVDVLFTYALPIEKKKKKKKWPTGYSE